MEEREVGDKRQSVAVTANEREGNAGEKKAEKRKDGSLFPTSPFPLAYLC